MSRNQRIALVAVAAVVAVAAFVIAKPGGHDDNASAPSAPAAKTGTGTAPRPATETIRIRGGKPVGGVRKIQVDKNEKVRIAVRSDAPDEVHLHGYDIEKEVSPGKPATFSFTAKFEGVFDIESHKTEAKLAKLFVGPSS
jgi:hypothetical protein